MIGRSLPSRAALSKTVFEHQYIHGAWTVSTNAPRSIEVINPNDAKVVAHVPDGSADDVGAAVVAARAAFGGWSVTPLARRKEFLAKMAEAYSRRKPDALDWFTKELGCTRKFAEDAQAGRFEVAWNTTLAEVDKLLWREATGPASCMVREPVGVVGCITPWNYPTHQIALKILPAMLVGCTVVLKPSEVTPVSAYLVAEAAHEAGLPPGVFNMTMGTGSVCGEAIAAHPEVDLVTFTGSNKTGKRLSEVAARSLKHVRTELGGKGATLLLEDANFEESIPVFMRSLLRNSGQSCNALSRMLVPRARHEEAVNIVKDIAERTVVSFSDDPAADIGPVVSEQQWERIQGYIERGISEGARLVAGGLGKPSGLEEGFFVKPTVFANVSNSMSIAQEEIFGPVLSVIPYDSEEDAITIANDTVYGLTNAVVSADVGHALRVAGRLRSGMVLVNRAERDSTAPFGGYKQSGNAREVGLAGLQEYLLTKSINVSLRDYEETFRLDQY
eukprot:TRINITY_DN30563_c0_g1_i1.p1 TRINITY_DN30563_c0_g1~~TRINITY_DN30563_c0_g1_i1.p1  ORF type:complete len:502 (+),score=72.28 TRINITY_DN30563_c0_g1_i1:52-1557(+)